MNVAKNNGCNILNVEAVRIRRCILRSAFYSHRSNLELLLLGAGCLWCGVTETETESGGAKGFGGEGGSRGTLGMVWLSHAISSSASFSGPGPGLGPPMGPPMETGEVGGTETA